MAEKRGKLQRLLDHLRLARTENPEELKREARLLLDQSAGSSICPLDGCLPAESLAPAPIDSPDTDRAALVEQLSARRAQSLLDLGAYPQVGSYGLADGKLLRYEPHVNVSDGASQDITYGYFDVNDAPPWDTWVCFSNRPVISWLPPLLVQLVQLGIDINSVDCIGRVATTQVAKLKAARA